MPVSVCLGRTPAGEGADNALFSLQGLSRQAGTHVPVLVERVAKAPQEPTRLEVL